MDRLLRITMTLQNGRTHLLGGDATSTRLLFRESIEDLMLFVTNLENVSVQATDASAQHDSKDLNELVAFP